MMVLSTLASYLVVALCYFWLAPNTEAFPASRLPELCRHTRLALLLGSRCDPYIQIDVDCQVSPWTAWTKHYENGCVEKRTRYIKKFQRNNGDPCPPLAETRLCDISGDISGGKSEAETALNKLKTGLGGFGAVGPSVNVPNLKTSRGGSVVVASIGRTNRFEGVQKANGPNIALAVQPAFFNATQPHSVVSRRAEMLCPPDRDIVLVIDSSGSVGENNFQQTFEDLGRLIPHLCGFQPDVITRCRSTRVAVVTYGSEPRLVFDLNHSKDRHTLQTNVQNDIQGLPKYLSSLHWSTATGDALQFAADRVLQETYGMRRHGKRTILLLTDGKSNHGSNPVTVASQLYNQYENLAIVALGIGSEINYDELVGITNHHNSYNPLVLLGSYQNFTDIVNEIIDLLGGHKQDTCQADFLDKKKRK